MEKRKETWLFRGAVAAWAVLHGITTWNTLSYLSSNSFFMDGALLGRGYRWTDYLALACYLLVILLVDYLLLRGKQRTAARNIKLYWLISLLIGVACIFFTDLLDYLGLISYLFIALTPFLPLMPLINPVTWILVVVLPVLNVLFCWWVQRKM